MLAYSDNHVHFSAQRLSTKWKWQTSTLVTGSKIRDENVWIAYKFEYLKKKDFFFSCFLKEKLKGFFFIFSFAADHLQTYIDSYWQKKIFNFNIMNEYF